MYGSLMVNSLYDILFYKCYINVSMWDFFVHILKSD